MEEQRLHSGIVLCGAVSRTLCLSELGEGGSTRQCTQVLGELSQGMPVNLGEKGLKKFVWTEDSSYRGIWRTFSWNTAIAWKERRLEGEPKHFKWVSKRPGVCAQLSHTCVFHWVTPTSSGLLFMEAQDREAGMRHERRGHEDRLGSLLSSMTQNWN